MSQIHCALPAWADGVFVQRHVWCTTGCGEVFCTVHVCDTQVATHCLQVGAAASEGSIGRVSAPGWHNSRGLDLCRGEDMLVIYDERLSLLAADDGRQGSQAIVDTHMNCRVLYPHCWCLLSQSLCLLFDCQAISTYFLGDFCWCRGAREVYASHHRVCNKNHGGPLVEEWLNSKLRISVVVEYLFFSL